MQDQEEPSTRAKVFVFLFGFLPFLSIIVLLLIGFFAKDGSAFLDHPVTTMCLGTCVMLVGGFIAVCAERVAREALAREAKKAARFSWLAKVLRQESSSESSPSVSLESLTRFYRSAGLVMVLIGIVIYIKGWQGL